MYVQGESLKTGAAFPSGRLLNSPASRSEGRGCTELFPMTIEEARKILGVWGEYLESVHARLMTIFILGSIPESLLPYTKAELQEAINTLAKLHFEMGDKETSEYTKTKAGPAFLYCDDSKSIDHLIEILNQRELDAKNIITNKLREYRETSISQRTLQSRGSDVRRNDEGRPVSLLRFLIGFGPYWDHWRRGVGVLTPLVALVTVGVVISGFGTMLALVGVGVFVPNFDFGLRTFGVLVGIGAAILIPNMLSRQFPNSIPLPPLEKDGDIRYIDLE